MKNFVKTFLATIFSIFLFCALFGGVVLFNVEHNLSKKMIVKSVKEVDVVEVIEELKYTEGMNSTTIIDEVYEEADAMGVSKETVDQFLNSNAVKETIGNVIGTLTEGALTGKSQELITVEEWNDMLDQAVSEIKENENIALTEEQEEKFLEEVKSHSDDIIERLPTTEEFTNTVTSQELVDVQYIFGEQVKILGIGSIILFVILIFLLKYKDRTWLLYLATPLMVLGIMLLISGVGILPIILNVLEESEVGTTIIQIAVSNFKNSFVISGIVALIVSIMCFIFHKVPKKKEEVVQ